jgi:uncharacterized Tic20 family protein
MRKQYKVEERIVAGLAHLLMMFGVLITLINLIGWPLFPKSAYYFLIPNAVLALLYWKRSAYARTNLVQAITYHVAGLLLGFVPAALRIMVEVGILGEKWQYTGWGGNGFTPTWGLMVLIVGFSGVAIFSLASDAAIKAFAGDEVRYPLLGKLADRLAA